MRVRQLDALRGVIMIVMALDHASGLIARGKFAPEMWASLFPDYQGNALAFLTRFVTHLAAPGFFFLMGAGMALFANARAKHGWDRTKVTRFFVLRGALLITLQFLLENPAWWLGKSGPPENMVYVGVLFALGSGMLIGSLLIRLPSGWLIGLSAVLILSTEFLLPAERNAVNGIPFLQALLMVPGYAPLGRTGLWVLYPALPWLGVVGLGIVFGRRLIEKPETTLRATTWFGLAALALFVFLRIFGGYGNIRASAGDSWIDFLNLVKYPPALVFLALTLGINLLLLRLLTGLAAANPKALQPLVVFGQAPLFFYITHLYLFGILGAWLAPDGMPIVQMLPFWLLGLGLLYPLCLWYSRFKNSRPADSLLRLF